MTTVRKVDFTPGREMRGGLPAAFYSTAEARSPDAFLVTLSEPNGDVDAFVRAAVWGGDFEKARSLLSSQPALARADLYCACASGEVESALEFLAASPELVTRKGGAKHWEPLLYVCFSAFLARESREEGARFIAIARQLLKLGADPNCAFLGEEEWGSPREPALYGASGIANHPGLTELLLEAGADPCDGHPEDRGSEAIYHTAEFRDLACMRLLFQHGVSQPAKDYCFYRQLDFERPEGTELFLKNGVNPNVAHPPHGTALHHAILRGRSVAVAALLVEHGANVNARREDGITPFQLASRLGRVEVAAFLKEHGADTRLTATDQFLSACAKADSEAVQKALAHDPNLVSHFSPEEHQLLALAAKENRVEAASLMLDAGLDIAVEDGGLMSLHWAAWFGHVEMVELLVARGAPLEAVNQYGGTPLGAAVYASRHCNESPSLEKNGRVITGEERDANYLRVAERLLAAGAKVHPRMRGLGTAAMDALLFPHPQD